MSKHLEWENFTSIFSTPFGKMGVYIHEDKLTALKFLAVDTPLKATKSVICQNIITELKRYFNNPKHKFNVDFKLSGTPFQKKVWTALQNIPSSKALTYGALAKQLQTGPRAIGQACRTNPLPLLIPCHRVVAANHLGGFVGKSEEGIWMSIKKWLLTHEGYIEK